MDSRFLKLLIIVAAGIYVIAPDLIPACPIDDAIAVLAAAAAIRKQRGFE